MNHFEIVKLPRPMFNVELADGERSRVDEMRKLKESQWTKDIFNPNDSEPEKFADNNNKKPEEQKKSEDFERKAAENKGFQELLAIQERKAAQGDPPPSDEDFEGVYNGLTSGESAKKQSASVELGKKGNKWGDFA